MTNKTFTNRTELLESIGFEVYYTELVTQSLSYHTTKAAKEVVAKIEKSPTYMVFINKEERIVTAETTWLVTKQEIKMLEKITGYDFIKAGTHVDNCDLWQEWIKLA